MPIGNIHKLRKTFGQLRQAQGELEQATYTKSQALTFANPLCETISQNLTPSQ